jgi:hypothetical protein
MFAEKNLSMRRLIPILVMVPILAFATGCYSGTKWKSGKYEVYWIDHSSDLTLGLELEDGNSIGRVGPQVFAVGEDDKWIVAARHPSGDKSKKEFYYFSKAADHPHKNADEIVLGPFTGDEFNGHKARLSLPDWDKQF